MKFKKKKKKKQREVKNLHNKIAIYMPVIPALGRLSQNLPNSR
jgi:hypothetical protein